MMKIIVPTLLLSAIVRAATIPPSSPDEGVSSPHVLQREASEILSTRPGMRVVQYDGPRYTMRDEDFASLHESWRTGGNWERPAGMPVIELEPGTTLDFGNSSDAALQKRSGSHLIEADSRLNCFDVQVQVKNFGCGTGCISLTQAALSGGVFQAWHANPYPTMDVWVGYGCVGEKQHMGVVDTYSCTNSNNVNGFKSFIGWFNC